METFQIHHTTLDILLVEPPDSQGAKGGSLAGHNHGNSAHKLELGYRMALAHANVRHMESIAFPGLDTQICGCTAQEAANSALAALQEFLGNNPKTSLRRILFVQYSRETYGAFCGALKSLLGPGSEPSGGQDEALSPAWSA